MFKVLNSAQSPICSELSPICSEMSPMSSSMYCKKGDQLDRSGSRFELRKASVTVTVQVEQDVAATPLAEEPQHNPAS